MKGLDGMTTFDDMEGPVLKKDSWHKVIFWVKGGKPAIIAFDEHGNLLVDGKLADVAIFDEEENELARYSFVGLEGESHE
jgi:hypothetical protein